MALNTLDHSVSEKKLSLSPALLEELWALPRKDHVVIHFVDFDGTIMGDSHRFKVDPALIEHRGDSAYGYITEKYGDERDPTGFQNFVKLMDPKNHLLDGSSEFFDPENPNHVILTAGNQSFQNEKIVAAWLWQAKAILVTKAEQKPEAMLQHLVSVGYIPGKIRFYDDRIGNFAWVDTELSKLLNIPVSFYMAIQDTDRQTVAAEKVEVNKKVEKILNP